LEVGDGDFRARVEEELRSLCLSRSAKLQATDPQRAIQILQEGLSVVRDLKMQEALAELFTQRGIGRVNDALREHDYERRGLSDAMVPALTAGLEDLRLAAGLGSERAEGQTRVVAGMLARCERAKRTSRELSFNELPQEARRRLASCVTGEADPRPLFSELKQGQAPLAVVVALAGAAALFVSLAAGFGSAAGAYQGAQIMIIDGPLLFAIAAGVLLAGRAFAERRARPFAPGRYVFPLDLVGVDRDGQISIRPTSDLESFKPVHHFANGRYSHTILTFQFKDRVKEEFRVSPRGRADEVLTGLQAASDAEREALQNGDLESLRRLDVLPGPP